MAEDSSRKRASTNDTTESFETTQTTETNISIPSHILIPNLPTIADVVENINAADAVQSLVSPHQLSNNTALGFAGKRERDEFGFFVDSIDASPPSDMTAKEKRELKSLEAEWLHLLDNWGSLSLKNKTKIKKLSRKGIPESLRGRAWMALTGSDRKLQAGKFEELCARAISDPRPAIFDVIDRDINRCYPTHIMFFDEDGGGQKNLRRILQAYALHNPELGYCQGMGMIVGILLMRMTTEEAFWTLDVILDYYMPDYHSVNLYQLRVDAVAFDICMRKFIRPLHKHMIELPPLTYMTQWFLTVYIMAMPWRTTLRIWDMFLHDGPKALFRVGLAILIRNKNQLLKKSPQSSDLLEHLLKAPREKIDSSRFINDCLKIRLGHKQLEKIRDQVKRVHSSLENNKKDSFPAIAIA